MDMKFFALSLTLLVFLISVNCLAGPWQLPKTKHPFSQRECTMCRFSVSLVNYALKTQKGAEQVQKIANSFCKLAHLESEVVCSNVTRLFEKEVVKVLAYGLVTPNQVCGLLSNNTCGHYQDPMADWEINLNASTNLDQDELRKVREALEQRLGVGQQRQPYKLIHISDTHVDLKYSTGSISNCEEPLCCHENSRPLNSSTPLKAGFWGSYTNCDVPLRTLESALKQINSTLTTSTDEIPYIIWTGDIQPHNVWEQDKKSSILTYDAVFEMIFKYLPNIKIFPTFGNHEMVPVDSFSPSNLVNIAREDSPEWLYKRLDNYWSRWLPNDTVTTITKDGFYSASLGDGLKIVSLNTNFCHNKNFWLYINSTDPGNQLQWLVHELQISELEHEKVHIIGHIPPGTSDCLKVWSKNYNKIVRRFRQTIGGQFFGHTHTNEFEVFYDQADTPAVGASQHIVDVPQGAMVPISVGFIGPSVTTFIGLNPSFRIYTIDPSRGFMPTDFETRYMNLTAANLAPVDQEPEWTNTGPFSKLFAISDVSPLSMHNFLVDVVKELKYELDAAAPESPDQPIDSSSDGKLLKLYRVYNSYSDVMTESKFDTISANAKREFLCKFFTSQSHSRFACDAYIGINANTSQIDPIGVL